MNASVKQRLTNPERFSIANYLSSRAIRKSGNQQAFRKLCQEVNLQIEREHLREGDKFLELKHNAIIGKKAAKETLKSFIVDYLRRKMLEHVAYPNHYPDLAEGIFQQEYGLGPFSQWFTLTQQKSAEINGTTILYQEQKGSGNVVMPFSFDSLDQVDTIITRLTMASSESKVNAVSPMEELFLDELKTRVTIFVPPVTRRPVIMFRKYPFNDFRFEAEAEYRTIDPDAVEWLKLLAEPLLNVAIVGPQSVGKTTLAKVWANYRPMNKKIALVEFESYEGNLERDFPDRAPFINEIKVNRDQIETAQNQMVRTRSKWALYTELRSYDVDFAFTTAERGMPFILVFHNTDVANLPATLARKIVDAHPQRDYLSQFLDVSAHLQVIVRMDETIDGTMVVESIDVLEKDEITNQVAIYPWMRFDEEKHTWMYQFTRIPAKIERRIIKDLGRSRYESFLNKFKQLANKKPFQMEPMFPDLNAFTRKG